MMIYTFSPSQICIFIGETLLFLNWAITADILMVTYTSLFLSSVTDTRLILTACITVRRGPRYNCCI